MDAVMAEGMAVGADDQAMDREGVRAAMSCPGCGGSGVSGAGLPCTVCSGGRRGAGVPRARDRGPGGGLRIELNGYEEALVRRAADELGMDTLCWAKGILVGAAKRQRGGQAGGPNGRSGEGNVGTAVGSGQPVGQGAHLGEHRPEGRHVAEVQKGGSVREQRGPPARGSGPPSGRRRDGMRPDGLSRTQDRRRRRKAAEERAKRAGARQG